MDKGIKIVFLDIDGVLNNIVYSEMWRTFHGIKKGLNEALDPANVNLFRLIVEKTEAKIVISSAWRQSAHFKRDTQEEMIVLFKELFEKYGWHNAPIIGITPRLGGFRGEEIATYLDTFPEKVEDYIIIDDDSDMYITDIHFLSDKVKLEVLNNKLKNLSSNWFNQKLLLTDKVVGFSYPNMIDMLKEWKTDDVLLEVHEDYEPYRKRYGKKFS